MTNQRAQALEAYAADNYEVAFNLFTELGNKGDVLAQMMLASMYFRGEGCIADQAQHSHWLGKIVEQAEHGGSEAQLTLSDYYRWGNGGMVPSNIDAANRWLRLAGENGDPDAQFQLSLYYRSEEFGFERDKEKSNLWLEKSVQQNYPDAVFEKALRLFENGKPTDTALALIRAAVKLGSLEATEWLGRLSE
jgi:hypothetical protein